MITQQLNQGGLPQGYKAWPPHPVEAIRRDDAGATDTGEGVAHGGLSPPPPPLKTPVEFSPPDLCEVLSCGERDAAAWSLPVWRSSVPGTSIARASGGFRGELRPLPETRGCRVVASISSPDRGGNFTRICWNSWSCPWKAICIAPARLYAVAYRTTDEGGHTRLEVWPERLALGSPLPTLPLWFDAQLRWTRPRRSYTATCEALRSAEARGANANR